MKLSGIAVVCDFRLNDWLGINFIPLFNCQTRGFKYDYRTGDFVVPSLASLVEGDPNITNTQKNYRYIVSEIPNNILTNGCRMTSARIHNSSTNRQFPWSGLVLYP